MEPDPVKTYAVYNPVKLVEKDVVFTETTISTKICLFSTFLLWKDWICSTLICRVVLF